MIPNCKNAGSKHLQENMSAMLECYKALPFLTCLYVFLVFDDFLHVASFRIGFDFDHQLHLHQAYIGQVKVSNIAALTFSTKHGS